MAKATPKKAPTKTMNTMSPTKKAPQPKKAPKIKKAPKTKKA